MDRGTTHLVPHRRVTGRDHLYPVSRKRSTSMGYEDTNCPRRSHTRSLQTHRSRQRESGVWSQTGWEGVGGRTGTSSLRVVGLVLLTTFYVSMSTRFLLFLLLALSQEVPSPGFRCGWSPLRLTSSSSLFDFSLL